MTDYNKWRIWKKVNLYTEQVYISKYEEYSPEDVFEKCKKLIEKAENQGLEGCYLKFESTMEPYEDYLGPVAITAVGYRKLNSEERKQLKEEDEIEALAKAKGIPVYEARNLKSLIDKGVVSDT